MSAGRTERHEEAPSVLSQMPWWAPFEEFAPTERHRLALLGSMARSAVPRGE
jgi:hypothetical protein